MEQTCTPPESLIRFNAPLYVGFAEAGKDKGAPSGPPAKKAGESSASQLDDMLNAMLPPREWNEETGTWMQYVRCCCCCCGYRCCYSSYCCGYRCCYSSYCYRPATDATPLTLTAPLRYVANDPATRFDVINLQERLDKRLLERQARETGICPVREDLYSQGFDELIRQVTLDGPERGLLLLRVRDEIRMTIDAYKTLYDSSVTFGIRKQLHAEQGMAALETQIETLEESKKELENRVLELRNRVEVVEKRETERKNLEDKKRKEEIDFLKYQGQHLDSFLRQLGGGK